jgi:hypothetical protein
MTHPFSKYLFYLSLILIIQLNGIKEGQSQEDYYQRSTILKASEEIYGIDDRLASGTYYLPKHPSAKGHPYFLSQDWQPATLYIKGNVFSSIPLKYNMEDDRLIIKLIYPKLVAKKILITNRFVDSLMIGNHILHNTQNLNTTNEIGIAERIQNGKRPVYLKQKKQFLEDFSGKNDFGIYPKPKVQAYVLQAGTFHSIKSKKDFLAYYSHTKELRSYMRKNRIRFKNANAQKLRSLFRFANQFQKY